MVLPLRSVPQGLRAGPHRDLQICLDVLTVAGDVEGGSTRSFGVG
jgi:hypothetical protein